MGTTAVTSVGKEEQRRLLQPAFFLFTHVPSLQCGPSPYGAKFSIQHRVWGPGKVCPGSPK